MEKPHVTELLKLLDKPNLLKWANKIGLNGIEIDEYRNKAMSEGSSLHKQIENYHIKNIPFNDLEIQKRYEKFIATKQIVDIEKNIETDLFRGRYDIKLFCEGNKYICDFKSQSKIYFENKLQLVAYRMAEPHESKIITKLAIIEIPNFYFHKIDIFDYEPYEEIIKALVVIYNNKKYIDEY